MVWWTLRKGLRPQRDTTGCILRGHLRRDELYDEGFALQTSSFRRDLPWLRRVVRGVSADPKGLERVLTYPNALVIDSNVQVSDAG